MTFQITGDGNVLADPLLLRRALSNLVANAIRYAYEGTEILMRVIQTHGGARIDVENQGPVLSDETLGHLFDRFTAAMRLATTTPTLTFLVSPSSWPSCNCMEVMR